MTERTEMERFIDWCNGEGLDGTRDYHGHNSAMRFRAYEKHMADMALETLIARQHGDEPAKTEG